jgi:hypothetical protein
MSWLNLIGTLAVGAVVVLALIAVFQILFRTPRLRHSSHQQGHNDAAPATAPGPKTRARDLERSTGADR